MELTVRESWPTWGYRETLRVEFMAGYYAEESHIRAIEVSWPPVQRKLSASMPAAHAANSPTAGERGKHVFIL